MWSSTAPILKRMSFSLKALSIATLCLLHLLALQLLADAQQTNQLNSTDQAQPAPKSNYLETGRQITGILNRFMSLGYDKRVRPNYGGPPVEVNVTMRILSISSVSEVMMDFTADFYFRQTWHDPRLSFKKLGDIQTLYVGAEVSKKIWLPDTFFGNEKLAYFHEATTPNVFLRIDHSGEVYRSIRLTVTSSCPMNLQYFPMDRQRCTIEAESYGYNVKDIIYRWARKDTAVERDKEISLPQFDIVKTVQKYRLEELSSGTYSRLIAEIHFARRMGYYLIQIYIPSSLIVVISWVSFWLHRNASPARVQLGVTTVLTMTTLMSSTNAALPKISYVKSIDIFLGTCFVMVFAALLEYATVGYLGKRIAMRKAHIQHAQSQAQARIFAQLQSQGAQGDPVPPVPTANLGEQVTSLLAQPVQPADMTSFRGASAGYPAPRSPETAPSPTERGRMSSCWHEQQRSAGCCPCCNQSTATLARCTSSFCRQAEESEPPTSASRTLPRNFFTLQAPMTDLQLQSAHLPVQHELHHLDEPHRQQQHCARHCQQLHQSHRGAGELGPRCHHSSSHLSRAQADHKFHPPSYHTQRQAQAQSQHHPVKTNCSSAAAAAAATFVNIHRRQRGLPPSTNPNFAQFAWIGKQNRAFETIFGVRPSDIDKYSRVVFPVCFVCFQLMYWIVYLHISAFLESEQQQSLPAR